MIKLIHFEPIPTALGATLRDVSLVRAKNVHDKAGCGKKVHAAVRLVAQTPEHKGRVKRHGGEGIDRHANRMIINRREHDRDTSGEPT